MPALPLVGSTITPPGRSCPLRSASATMASATRSLTDPRGLKYSSLSSSRPQADCSFRYRTGSSTRGAADQLGEGTNHLTHGGTPFLRRSAAYGKRTIRQADRCRIAAPPAENRIWPAPAGESLILPHHIGGEGSGEQHGLCISHDGVKRLSGVAPPPEGGPKQEGNAIASRSLLRLETDHPHESPGGTLGQSAIPAQPGAL